ncbi:hypothetical protein [Nonomuraea salmonea]|uniref:hypothetical protein n=1 Tax=Nonomuraea salmonea TaxID=46181 RepID=UPI0031EC0EB5
MSPSMKSPPSTGSPAFSLARSVAWVTEPVCCRVVMKIAPGSGTATNTPRSGRPSTQASPSKVTVSRAARSRRPASVAAVIGLHHLRT